MTDTRWCSYFEKYAPAFIDRTVDLTLNALIGADYPDIVIDRFVNETHETGSHPFKIEENFGPSSDLKCTDTDFIWTYSWTTTMSGSGTPLVDTYPVVSRKESYGNA